jgi:pimeloyl-ACP methyl ester carboxylesterase
MDLFKSSIDKTKRRTTSAKYNAGFRRFASLVLSNYICAAGFILRSNPALYLAANVMHKHGAAHLETIRKYGKQPFQIGLLHGGPGASGEMKPVAEKLSCEFGILEFLQTEKSVNGQIEELHNQLTSNADLPAILIGYSWGAWLGFLFASRYPDLLKKLILISSGAFESKYNNDLMNIRLNRLNKQDRKEAERLISVINSDGSDNEILRRFGKLMTIADSYDYLPVDNDSVDLDLTIYQSVWAEASRLRDTNELMNRADKIKSPVVAIHGDYDSHPIDGVEKPLSNKLCDFKMIRIKNCGHTPWRERYAKDTFFEILRNELYLITN